jgi:hypothetical protein
LLTAIKDIPLNSPLDYNLGDGVATISIYDSQANVIGLSMLRVTDPTLDTRKSWSVILEQESSR